MKTSRLEAFSDGVIAVIITIMVLELKVPHTAAPEALLTVVPSLLVYGMSFAVVAIMWVNHHHFLEKARHANAALLWANNNLLFWMSLIPFVTAYLGENCHAPLAVAVYGAVMAFASLAFLLLQITLAKQDTADAARQLLFRRLNHKALTSMVFYTGSVGLAFVSVYASFAIFVIFPLLYFWPERKAGLQRAEVS
ncbi:MAG: TMEM175 family protein [Terracidiphilus sp.]|nr:TMEM175 family protein [Terracidiphilus sp.]